jgi:hypothetical protein
VAVGCGESHEFAAWISPISFTAAMSNRLIGRDPSEL